MSTPIGPYTPIVSAGPWLICSGQLGMLPVNSTTGPSEVEADLDLDSPVPAPPTLVAGGAGPQLVQALSNAERLLRGKGAGLHDVVKTTVFLADMDDYAVVNEAYVAVFGQHRPARSVVGVAGLPLGAAVEVELWAYPTTSN